MTNPLRNDSVAAVLDELQRWGLQGEVSHRGKHIEVRWELPDGRSKFYITSATPSDSRRGRLNARGDIRKMLRELGCTIPPPVPVTSFAKAISLPAPVEHPTVRISGLEEDVSILLDWLIDLRDDMSALRTQLSNMRVTISFDAAVPAPVSAPAPVDGAFHSRAAPGTRYTQVLAHMPVGQWVTIAHLREQTKMKGNNLSNTLLVLKQKGLVEKGLYERGQWRRLRTEKPTAATG